MYQEKKFDWLSLILGIVFIILGCWSLKNPDTTLSLLSILVGIGAILKGIYELSLRSTINNLLGINSAWLLIMAILDIILGMIFIFHIAAGVMTISIIFAFWFIIDCTGQLSVARFYKQFQKGYYWLLVILNVLGIIIGIALFFNPMVSAATIVWLISFFLILLGILAIVAAF